MCNIVYMKSDTKSSFLHVLGVFLGVFACFVRFCDVRYVSLRYLAIYL